MKQRFSSLDVKVIAHELSSALCSLRLSNIYDLSSRIFLLKFAKPNYRQQLILDSGFRCHLTSFARATAAAPSSFVVRLRKFLRTRRVTAVAQVGTDRIIEIQFGDGLYRLFLEFYAGGNIVLTDKELNILALQRIVSEAQDQQELRVGVKYTLENRQNYGGVPPLTQERVLLGLQKAAVKAAAESHAHKKAKNKPADALRKALAVSLTELPPLLIDHVMHLKEFDTATPVKDVIDSREKLGDLMVALEEARSVVERVTSSDVSKGYIIAKTVKKRPKGSHPTEEEPDTDKENVNLLYEDFHPFRPQQFEGLPDHHVLEFEGFNKTVDEFFSSVESQKLESRLTEREETARRKLENARKDHKKRLGGLQQVQELNVQKAQAIEGNLQRVQEATAAVNGLIAQGMDWVEIARLIEMEQERQNPVAEMVKLPLKLYENTVTLLLDEGDFEDEEDFEGDETDSEISESDDEASNPSKPAKIVKAVDKRLAVDVDLALSPWANARQYYDQKKSAAVKEQRTLQSSTMALKSAEKKITADLKKGLKQEKQALRPVRRQLWFEKFFYFISSEGYLVLGGRDAQQNEILYKKYLSKGDIYVHADIPGATSIIVKNKGNMMDSPIPPSTLSQAGSFAVTTSTAWDSKAVMAAWWVESHHVSKTGPTGDYLGLGLFYIKGQKNFLPPAQLLLGFGVMFLISDESRAKHLKHRVADDIDATTNEEQHILQKIPGDRELQESGREVDDIFETNSQDSEVEDRLDQMVLEDSEPMPQYDNPLQPAGNAQSSANAEDSIMPDIEEIDSVVGENPLARDESSDDDDDDSTEQNALLPSKPKVSALADQASASVKTPQVRGKRGKQAKIKAKYADQDEEDRELAMELLGSTSGQKAVKVEAEKKVARDAELVAQKERRREQHIRAQQAGKQAEEARRIQLDEGEDIMDEDEATDFKLVDHFVGTPLAGDEILDCIVVCGPWDSMGAKLKYRIKIQPGAQKKGKAVKEILDSWNKIVADREKKRMPGPDEERFEEETTARREGELLRALRDVEVVGVIPVGKVRVMVPGGGTGDKGKGGKSGGGGKGNRGGKGSKKGR